MSPGIHVLKMASERTGNEGGQIGALTVATKVNASSIEDIYIMQ